MPFCFWIRICFICYLTIRRHHSFQLLALPTHQNSLTFSLTYKLCLWILCYHIWCQGSAISSNRFSELVLEQREDLPYSFVSILTTNGCSLNFKLLKDLKTSHWNIGILNCHISLSHLWQLTTWYVDKAHTSTPVSSTLN